MCVVYDVTRWFQQKKLRVSWVEKSSVRLIRNKWRYALVWMTEWCAVNVPALLCSNLPSQTTSRKMIVEILYRGWLLIIWLSSACDAPVVKRTFARTVSVPLITSVWLAKKRRTTKTRVNAESVQKKSNGNITPKFQHFGNAVGLQTVSLSWLNAVSMYYLVVTCAKDLKTKNIVCLVLKSSVLQNIIANYQQKTSLPFWTVRLRKTSARSAGPLRLVKPPQWDWHADTSSTWIAFWKSWKPAGCLPALCLGSRTVPSAKVWKLMHLNARLLASKRTKLTSSNKRSWKNLY